LDGRREVLGMDIGPSEAEPFWTRFLIPAKRRHPLKAAAIFSRQPFDFAYVVKTTVHFEKVLIFILHGASNFSNRLIRNCFRKSV
jgi:hypothetical protein